MPDVSPSSGAPRFAPDSPILNDPWTGPVRHWQLSNVTGETVETDEPRRGRRLSGDDERVQAGRNAKPSENGASRVRERAPHPLINHLRVELADWRRRGRPGVRGPVARLLERWLPASEAGLECRPQPDEPLPYWCQVEAVETAVWLLEAGRTAAADAWRSARDTLADANRRYNDGIDRLCVKMATGTGKTWVMAMLVAWWSESELAGDRPQLLVITPNTTVRDRLAVLKDARDAMWGAILGDVRLRRRPRIEIINEQRWCARREVYDPSGGKPDAEALKYLRAVQTDDERAARAETMQDVADRLLHGFRPGQPVLVLNDEGHHCWRGRVGEGRSPRRVAGERADAAHDRETAGRWFGILSTLQQTGRLGPVVDLSATPFWRDPPEDADSPLFPWTVSNTPLIEAIECGLVKIPIAPTRDDAQGATRIDRVFYRDTYRALQDTSTDGKRKPIDLKRSPSLPTKLDQLVEWMAEDYERVASESSRAGTVAPVLIVVTDTIDNANAIWRRIGGTIDPETGRASAGITPRLSNVADGLPRDDAPTLLVHSKLDNGESRANAECLSQVEAFFPRPVEAGRPVGIEKYKQHIRAIRDTAGVVGTPGRHVRCVVSVLQLSEGWDCKGVSHVIGFRPFDSPTALRTDDRTGAPEDHAVPQRRRVRSRVRDHHRRPVPRPARR